MASKAETVCSTKGASFQDFCEDPENRNFIIRNEKEDMLDEISKRNNPTPKDGEIVIKID